MALPLIPIAISSAFTVLFAIIARAIPFITGRVLLFLGIGFASVTGMSLGYDQLITLLQGQLNNIPYAAASILKMAGFITAMSYILSALAFKLSLKLVNGAMNFFTRKSSTMWA